VAQTARSKGYSGFIQCLDVARCRGAEWKEQRQSPQQRNIDGEKHDQHNQGKEKKSRGKPDALSALCEADVRDAFFITAFILSGGFDHGIGKKENLSRFHNPRFNTGILPFFRNLPATCDKVVYTNILKGTTQQ